jgi:hypothetical protein
MTPQEAQALCTHAPAYQKGCIACCVRYVKMLRSPDAKLSRKKQNEYLAELPKAIAEQVIEILRRERECS